MTVQQMEYSARSVTSMTIFYLFADLMGGDRMKKQNHIEAIKMNRCDDEEYNEPKENIRKGTRVQMKLS